MKYPDWLPIFGNLYYRGDCPLENAELITFIQHMQTHYKNYPVLHIKNEGKRTHRQSTYDRAIGALQKGAADIIIPGSPSLCIEIKRQDHTKSSITDDQIKFLLKSKSLGSYVCVALGFEGAITAFKYWASKYGLVTCYCDNKKGNE